MIDPGIIKVSAYISAGIAVGTASLATGIGSGYIAGGAVESMERQPGINDKLFRSMLIGQAATGTGAILSLVIGLLLLFGGFDNPAGGWYRVASLLGAGLAIGLGAIGSGYGAGAAGGQACVAMGRVPDKNATLLGNMLIGQALSQSVTIYALLISLMLLYSTPLQPEGLEIGLVVMKSVALVASGICIGFGSIGSGIGIGELAGKANMSIAKVSKGEMGVMRVMFIGSAVTQSTAVYALIVSFLLMFVL